MKRTILFAVACLLAANHCFAQKNLKLMNSADSVSYLIGMMTGSQLAEGVKTTPVEDFNFKAHMAGYTAALSGEKTIMSTEEAQRYLQNYFAELSNKGIKENKQKGEQFLAQNKLEAGVVQTASGLQYKIVNPGEGAKPTSTDKVTVHYKGTTLDGKVFDSSYNRDSPATFQLDQVIRGWTEGVQLMPVGSKYIFWIPSDLAYGDRGAGKDIKPGETLVFEVELLAIVEEPKEEKEPVVEAVDTTFRKVGDYERIKPEPVEFDSQEEEEGAFQLKDYVVAIQHDRIRILDKDKKEIFSTPADSTCRLDDVAFYLPLQEKSPYIVAASRLEGNRERGLVDIYLIDQQKNTVIYAGRMNIQLPSDVLMEEIRETLFYMNISRQKSDLIFSFDTPYLVYYNEGGDASIRLPASDFYFAYSKKNGIQPKGEATNLSFFKKKK